MSLTVIKSDGSSESYIHTRVMATISSAISDAGCYNEQTVSALSDAVRMYIEDCRDESTSSSQISSDEIYSMILATLNQTGNSRAAVILKEHRINRQIKRKRQMVLHCLKSHLSKKEQDSIDIKCCLESGINPCRIDDCPYLNLEPWNKSRLANKLINRYNLTKNAARVVASNIENKVFGLKISAVRSMLIDQLILNELYFFRNTPDFIEHSNQQNTKTSEINETTEKRNDRHSLMINKEPEIL